MILCGIVSGISVLALFTIKKKLPSSFKKAFSVLLFMSILGFIIGIGENSVLEGGNRIKRNPAGNGDYQEELNVSADGILNDYHYLIEVPEQIFTEEEEQQYLSAAQREIADEFCGENESLNQIREKTVIRNRYQNGMVEAQWMFDDYEIMDMAGNVIAEDIPNQGIVVKAAVNLKCGGSECEYQFYFHVFPEILNEQEQFLKSLREILRKEKEKRGAEYLELPVRVGRYTVIWSEKGEHLPEKLMFMGIVLAILIPVSEQRRQGEKEKERTRRLLLEYPEILSKLALLLGAGMTLGGAWKRIAYSYKKKQQKQNEKCRPAYEEMLYTVHQMDSGIGEAQAYMQFGERCKLQKYKRLSGMLVQNLRKGNRELMEMLLFEADHAFEERKNLARKYGEEAGTKLLFPMLLLLGIIMVILLVPALLSFQL